MHRLFQKSYLPGVIEIVLDHAVQQEPDAVRVRDGFGGGLFGCNAAEQFAQRRAVPGLPFLSAFELAVDAMSLCQCSMLSLLRFKL